MMLLSAALMLTLLAGTPAEARSRTRRAQPDVIDISAQGRMQPTLPQAAQHRPPIAYGGLKKRRPNARPSGPRRKRQSQAAGRRKSAGTTGATASAPATTGVTGVTGAAAGVVLSAPTLAAPPASAGRAAPAGAIPLHQAAGGARADTLRILTLNAEHLMSADIGERWLHFCGAQQWRDGEQARPAGLPYCTALNGKDQRGWQQSRPVRSLADLENKARQLAALVAKTRPDIVLLQEITDAAAAARVLGKGWHIRTTAELWPGEPISQHLGVAWRRHRFVQPPRVTVVEALAQRTAEGHRTRPGLALRLELPGGLPLSILNVHLKAGCRHGRLERGLSRQPGRQWRRHGACRVLQAQVPTLESWLDAELAAGRQVVLSGDFNRALRDEIKLGLPARSDGSPADAPLTGPGAHLRISSLLAELDDGVPNGARLHLVRNGPYRRHAECHRHIDPFVLSEGLLSRLGVAPTQLRAEVIPFAGPVSLDTVRPSDHCPHLLALPLRRP